MRSFSQKVKELPIWLFLYGLKYVYPVSVVTLHLYTTYLGFTEGGVIGGIAALSAPVIAEVYLMIALWGVDNFYVTLVIVHFLFALPHMALRETLEKL